MGSFNSQYGNYYNTLSKKNYGQNRLSYNGQSSFQQPFFTKKKLLRTFEIQLIGTLVLFLVAFTCKIYVNPQTKAVYTYSKSIVNQNFDYKSAMIYLKEINVNSLIASVKSGNITDIQSKVINWIDILKTKFTGGKTTRENISHNFILPVSGKLIQSYGSIKDNNKNLVKFRKGINIYSTLNSDVKASYDGFIKEIGEDKSLGKYLVIDHGSGIETKYAHMDSLKVKKGDKVIKGQIIGRAGSTEDRKNSSLYFELTYMGEELNPQEYLNI
ncbi:peptidase family M23 [Clostridium pasteurianum DSM 525 = ATCC 6013]|uniref:Peptidase M23 n=1 Tax=Clostridium pasteurianum DSM 525 = ATCC 6013 TaxID=1262449 RepID=A0A0H3J5E3_CLOPA|nr:M23 family metallopeptidase [Clostridium pasteurianum]AJA48412.1 peptidase family M23 [Clostridium pasteurianum DSM 525 = ATCC 6013]AJA52400.1 peptidase family M23 [Clostridium pasteurianum DSM 525 = ATCC 6013]AOZ75657.1 membrane metalloendopeptidase [Clostridium pasteurianum DSM 525 = ATCC 6013]AOZ79453.1 membrane metalloendopeptidase [Clostridium pasteurianum]ELP60438.1 putative membrane metalloendopeptidase [Clostridium pasteurianum DSM 525 = ATCC 6013]